MSPKNLMKQVWTYNLHTQLWFDIQESELSATGNSSLPRHFLPSMHHHLCLLCCMIGCLAACVCVTELFLPIFCFGCVISPLVVYLLSFSSPALSSPLAAALFSITTLPPNGHMRWCCIKQLWLGMSGERPCLPLTVDLLPSAGHCSPNIQSLLRPSLFLTEVLVRVFMNVRGQYVNGHV